MVQIRKIILLLLFPLLLSWVPSTIKQQRLDVNVEVLQKKGKTDVKVEVLGGVPNFKLEIIGIEGTQVYRSSDNYFYFPGIKTGKYYIVVTDSKYKVKGIHLKI